MADPTEVVGVLRVHLEEVREALDWYRGLTGALDLADSYRQGKMTVRPSRGSQMAQKGLQTCDMYLRVEEDPDDADQ